MSRRRCRITALFVAILPAILLSGCDYPEVSPRTYEISKALYRVCNQRESDRLDVVTKLIVESEASGEITADEADWLNDIIADAKSGEWEEALAEVRDLMEDQVVQ